MGRSTKGPSQASRYCLELNWSELNSAGNSNSMLKLKHPTWCSVQILSQPVLLSRLWRLARRLGQAVWWCFTGGSLSAKPLCTDQHVPGHMLPGDDGTGRGSPERRRAVRGLAHPCMWCIPKNKQARNLSTGCFFFFFFFFSILLHFEWKCWKLQTHKDRKVHDSMWEGQKPTNLQLPWLWLLSVLSPVNHYGFYQGWRGI